MAPRLCSLSGYTTPTLGVVFTLRTNTKPNRYSYSLVSCWFRGAKVRPRANAISRNIGQVRGIRAWVNTPLKNMGRIFGRGMRIPSKT